MKVLILLLISTLGYAEVSMKVSKVEQFLKKQPCTFSFYFHKGDRVTSPGAICVSNRVVGEGVEEKDMCDILVVDLVTGEYSGILWGDADEYLKLYYAGKDLSCSKKNFKYIFKNKKNESDTIMNVTQYLSKNSEIKVVADREKVKELFFQQLKVVEKSKKKGGKILTILRDTKASSCEYNEIIKSLDCNIVSNGISAHLFNKGTKVTLIKVEQAVCTYGTDPDIKFDIYKVYDSSDGKEYYLYNSNNEVIKGEVE